MDIDRTASELVRHRNIAAIAQSVERIHGKDEAPCSIQGGSTTFKDCLILVSNQAVPPDLIFVLGAQDPEMRAIEEVLNRAGLEFAYAAIDHVRCSAANAYRADSLVRVGKNGRSSPVLAAPNRPLAFVESRLSGRARQLHIDHHHEGDPGFSCEPARYLEGSSLGQVLTLLNERPSDLQRLLCAADHCLTAAYQGDCPDVDPGELLFMRAAWRALLGQESLDTKIGHVLSAADRIRAVFDPALGEATFLDPTQVPAELAEGAAYAGLPVRYRILSMSGGHLKECIKGASFDRIEAFINHHRNEGRRAYGNPYRGYAGAYLG